MRNPWCVVRSLFGATGRRLLLGWSAWWALLAGASNCPCCGRTGCPVGIAGLGVVAAIVSGATTWISSRFRRKPRRQGAEQE